MSVTDLKGTEIHHTRPNFGSNHLSGASIGCHAISDPGVRKSQIPVAKRSCKSLHKCSICAKVKSLNLIFEKIINNTFLNDIWTAM